MADDREGEAEMMVVGHRGARDLWPENSLSGFRNVIAMGVDAVELDVHLTHDGEVVVIHDPTLDRTTTGRGPVRDLSVEMRETIALRDSLDEGIPTLDAALDLLAGSPIELHIEIKTDGDGSPYPGLEVAVAEKVRSRQLAGHSVLTSFSPTVLQTVADVFPGVRRLASLSRNSSDTLGGLERALAVFDPLADVIAVEKSLLSAAWTFISARIPPERLGVWVPNDLDDLAFWLRHPLRQVTTDRPDLAMAVRQRVGIGMP